ncbi:MAG: CheR family methyltransferase [Gammaproteobacteria bacterium]|nr:CheR family methyltransferase [Gammaproteobacteria bacterium]
MPIARSALAPLLETLRRRTGHDFTQYRDEVLSACVRSRMARRDIAHLDDYLARAVDDAAELDRLFEELTRGVTRFFRDADDFAWLAARVVPRLRDDAAERGAPIRVWVPGCASGEEAYSLAIVLVEALDDSTAEPGIQIWGTDIDAPALETARLGNYARHIENDLSPARLERFFEPQDDGYRVKSSLRAMCEFSHHDLNEAPASTLLDLISCRYVFPYVKPGLRHQLLPRFHSALRPGGILFLGATEDVTGAEDLFQRGDPAHAIFQAMPLASADANDAPRRRTAPDAPTASTELPATGSDASLDEKLEAIIAELDEVNRTLRYRVNELETLVDLVPMGLLVCEDRTCNEAKLNRTGAAILGYPGDAGVTVQLDAPLPYRLYARGRELAPSEYPLERAVGAGESTSNEVVRLVREDGEERDILVSAAPLYDDDGAVRGAIAAFMDITGQATAWRALEERNVTQSAVGELSLFALSESEPQPVLERAVGCVAEILEVEYAAVFELEPDEDRFALRAGRGWEAEAVGSAHFPAGADYHLGYTALMQEPAICEDYTGEKRFSVPGDFLARGITGGAAVVIPGPAGPWGVLGALSTRVRAFPPADIEFLQTVANVIGAMHRRDQLEVELAHSRERLAMNELKKEAERAEQLATLGTLAAGIAHEINNPLNAVMVNAELGLMRAERGEDIAKIRDSFQTIVNEVRRCADITKRVLELAKNRSAPKALNDLNTIVRRARELVDSHLQIHDATIELELADLPSLYLDPISMESALVNLFRNAAEAGEKGVTISVRTRLTSDRAELRIADDGPGISSEHIERIFDPFFSFKNRTKGTGLGLSMVHRTVKDHGGTIEVSSQPGEGAEFRVLLPLSSDIAGA